MLCPFSAIWGWLHTEIFQVFSGNLHQAVLTVISSSRCSWWFVCNYEMSNSPKCLTTPLPFTPTSGNAKHTMHAHSHKHTFHRAESVTCRAVCEWAAASCAHLSESQPSPAAERGRKSFSKWISLVESNVICFHTYFSVAYLLQYKLKKVSDFFFLSKSFKNLVALNLSVRFCLRKARVPCGTPT